MKWQMSSENLRSDFIREVEERSGQDVSECYQCGKCSAGCPLGYYMSLPPNQVNRMIQLGMKDVLMGSSTIWLCISCKTCVTRCPREMDLPKIIDALREMSSSEDQKEEVQFWELLRKVARKTYQGMREALEVDPEHNREIFSRVFLENVRRFGRSFETGLIGGYNTSSWGLFTNVLKAPDMVMKGKIGFTPDKVKNTEKIRRIFEKVEELEEVEI